MNLPLNINFQQVFLHMFNFVILFGALYFLLYKPVVNFMNKREAHYREMDQAAKDALAAAEATQADYQQKLSAVDEEIAQKNEAAKAELEKALDVRRQEAQTEAEEIVAKARKSATAEHDRIVGEAESEISKMVAQAAEKLAITDISEAYDQFLKSAGGSDTDA